MKKNVFLGAMTLTLLFAGCSNEEESFANGKNAQVKFMLNGVVTRTVTDASSGTTTFIEGDEVVVYSEGLATEMQGVKFKVTGTADHLTQDAMDENTYTYKGEEGAKFYAYYPATATGTNTNATFTVATDQSGNQSFDRSDFMTANPTAEIATANAIQLQFNHRLTLVKVQLTGIEATAVTINAVKPTVMWNYADNTITCKADTEAVTIVMGKNEGITSTTEYWAVVPAQAITTGEALITVTTSDSKYTYTPASVLEFKECGIMTFNLATSTEESKLVALSVLEARWGEEVKVEGTLVEETTPNPEGNNLVQINSNVFTVVSSTVPTNDYGNFAATNLFDSNTETQWRTIAWKTNAITCAETGQWDAHAFWCNKTDHKFSDYTFLQYTANNGDKFTTVALPWELVIDMQQPYDVAQVSTTRSKIIENGVDMSCFYQRIKGFEYYVSADNTDNSWIKVGEAFMPVYSDELVYTITADGATHIGRYLKLVIKSLHWREKSEDEIAAKYNGQTYKDIHDTTFRANAEAVSKDVDYAGFKKCASTYLGPVVLSEIAVSVKQQAQ